MSDSRDFTVKTVRPSTAKVVLTDKTCNVQMEVFEEGKSVVIQWPEELERFYTSKARAIEFFEASLALLQEDDDE